ncbi:hypothetical protein, partial [Streptomyces chartreusis]|uniref:hypothetical protein n=1 Tax=Streptomyces chartreusis TaxID=1969 RepID=UPI0036C42DCB
PETETPMNATPDKIRAATDRARVLARIARDRFSDPETMRTLGDIARHLSAAADALANYTPSTIPGLAGHDAPSEAWEELFIADTLAYDHSATFFPGDFTEYVKAPISGRPLPFPDPLNPLADWLGVRELVLRKRLKQLHDDNAQANENVDEWLTAVFTVWRDWMELAGEIADDNAKAYHRR